MDGNAPAETPVHGNRYYNSKEARRLLGGMSESRFRQITASKRLAAVKDGSKVLVSQKAIDDYIASLPTAAKDDVSGMAVSESAA